MIDPINTRPIGPDKPDLVTACLAAQHELQQLYADHYHQGHDQYVDFISGWKEAAPPEGADLDQAIMADTVASAAVKKQLAIVIAKHLPGAALLATITEPAVLDSTWLFDGQEICVEWDYRKNFGDPAGLTVTARIEVAQ